MRVKSLSVRPPETLSEWLSEMDELSEISISNPREFAKRASTTFVTKWRNGKAILEKKIHGKRAAFGNKQATDSIRNGTWKLTNKKPGKQAKETKYDSVTVVEHKDFETIANSFLLRFSMTGNTTTSNVTSEAITSQTDTLQTMHTNIAQTAVAQTADKEPHAHVRKKTTDELKKSEKSTVKKVLEQEEKMLEAEKEELEDEKKLEAKVLRDKELNQSIDQTKDTTKQAVLTADNKDIAAKKAEETDPIPNVDEVQSPLAPPS